MARQTTIYEDEDLKLIIKNNILIEMFDEIFSYIQNNIEPDEIYDRGELDDWAIAHGYVKENE